MQRRCRATAAPEISPPTTGLGHDVISHSVIDADQESRYRTSEASPCRSTSGYFAGLQARIHKVSATPLERRWGAVTLAASSSDQERGCTYDVSPAHPGRTIPHHRTTDVWPFAGADCPLTGATPQHDHARAAPQRDPPRRQVPGREGAQLRHRAT